MIKGKKVHLQPATEQNKRIAYEWLAESDITPSIMGPPHFPDHPVPTWDEFCADYKEYYFDGSEPTLGRCFIITVHGTPVGIIAYNNIDERHRRTTLDIWMSCETNCGKGYGSDALQALCEYLFHTYGIVEIMIEPSARNHRAIRTYEKAGFQRTALPKETARKETGGIDYYDSVFLVKRIQKARLDS